MGLFSIYVCMDRTHGEVAYGATFKIGRFLAQNQAPDDIRVK